MAEKEKKKAGRPKKKHPGGRPPKIDDKVLSKLEQAFMMGCTDDEACLFADIAQKTLYRYIEKNPEFRQRKETLKQNPVLKARSKMFDLIDSDDHQIAIKASTDVLNRNLGKPTEKQVIDLKVDGIELIPPTKPNES